MIIINKNKLPRAVWIISWSSSWQNSIRSISISTSWFIFCFKCGVKKIFLLSKIGFAKFFDHSEFSESLEFLTISDFFVISMIFGISLMSIFLYILDQLQFWANITSLGFMQRRLLFDLYVESRIKINTLFMIHMQIYGIMSNFNVIICRTSDFVHFRWHFFNFAPLYEIWNALKAIWSDESWTLPP